jgi:hypothetical protein
MTPQTFDGAAQRSRPAPLSAAQRRLWTLLHRRGRELRHVASCEILEPLDVGRLGAAVQQLVRRHDVLRTYYPRTSGLDQPQAVVASIYEPVIEVAALEEVPAEQRRQRLADLFRMDPTCLRR